MIEKKINQEQKMPNPELIANLYETYYVNEASPLEHLSSHWKEYTQRFRIRVDAAGFPTELVGYGFGHLQVPSLPHQLLSLGGVLVDLTRLPNKLDLIYNIGAAWGLARRMGLSFTHDAFRQVCSLSLIKQNLSEGHQQKRMRILIIGDGYGFLGSLFKEIFPNSSIVLVDLGKVLMFQAYYCQKAHPGKVHRLVSKGERKNLDSCDFVYCPAEYLDGVSGLSYDVAVNITSMQEMTVESVADYFRFLRQHMEVKGLFYCCNREIKILTGGEVQEFARYPWHSKDIHFVDEHCPWYKYYLAFITKSNGPKILGTRIPFVNYFDGPTCHRLTRLSREQ